MDIVYTNRINLNDLDLYECGTQHCNPEYGFGPAVRDFYILHYILEGKGFFKIGDKIYYLQKGKGFLICPGIVVQYQADKEDPWQYSWMGFQGAKAETFLKKAGITLESPIFEISDIERVKSCFNMMMETKSLKNGRELYLTGFLYQLLAMQIEAYSWKFPINEIKNRKEQYINTAVRFIKSNYWRDIDIRQIASQVGLDGKYLSAIFKECLNTSPYRLLMDTRMDKACELAGNEFMTIGDIARSVGYTDPLLFSRMFKRVKGMSPRDYKKMTLGKK